MQIEMYLLKVEILMGLALTSDEREGWAAWVEQGVKGRNSLKTGMDN